jgi:hypothetical protein
MGRGIMIVLIFVAAGPLIGLATLSGLLTILASSQESIRAMDKSVEPGDPAAFGLFILLYGVLFAHFFGALWAALAGFIVAVRAALWGPASIFEGVPIGVLTALASTVYFNVANLEADGLERIQIQTAAGWALVHIVSTMACIWLTRGWQAKVEATR